MALTDEGGMVYTMPVAPAYGGGNGGFGGFGNGDGWWLILLLLCGFGGGWGGMGGMWPMMMGAGMGGFGMDYLYPWLNNSQHISDGFRDQQINTAVQGIQQSVTSGFGDVQLGLAGVTGAVRDGFASAEIAANGRQMASMQQGFGIQTAMQQGFCDNRAATLDVKYTLASEAAATRAAANADTQRVLDKLCQLELDGVKAQLSAKDDIIAQLRQENLYARGQASQVAQTAEIRANNATVANQLISELRSCPIPAQPVYGNTPIWTCAQNVANNQGCGCNGVGLVA